MPMPPFAFLALVIGSWDMTPVLLPGAPDFVMTLYGAPSTAADLAPLLDFVAAHGLTQGLDPGPAASAPDDVYALLAGANLSLVQMYPGGDFEVPDGDTPGTSLTADNTRRMRQLNASAATTVSVGFGEFGYFFHCLHTDLAWWHSIYPQAADFERHKHGITPQGLFGYGAQPRSHAEAYAAVAAYVAQRRADYGGWMASQLTGYLHYAEMYGARWGAAVISMEIGEGITPTQSKIAFARGSSRANRLPFSCQVSPWHGPSVTTHGPVVQSASGTWSGAAAGHSASFYHRMYLHAWFAGAAFLTPENSIAIFFDETPDATHAGNLSAHGEAARRGRQLMRTHARGTPHIPLAVVIDDLAGYSVCPCNVAASAWGIFSANSQAEETAALPEAACPVQVLRDLFEGQLWPSAGRGDGTVGAVEQLQLRPTPYGELADVVVSGDAPGALLGAYSAILLAGGDIDFARVTPATQAGAAGGSSASEYHSSNSTAANSTLAQQLLLALRGSTETVLLLQSYHAEALVALGALAALNASGQVQLLEPWVNPETGRATAISNTRLRQLEQQAMPVAVTATRHTAAASAAPAADSVAAGAFPPACASGHVWDATRPLCAAGSSCATECTSSTCGCASPCDNCACCPACGGAPSCATCCVVPAGPTPPPTPPPPTPAQVQYQINQIGTGERSAAGWVVEVFNNDGVTKPINAAATLDAASYTYDVVLAPRVAFKRAVRWYWDHDEPLAVAAAAVNITLGPGESAYVHFEV
jgi:hypothetical protein